MVVSLPALAGPEVPAPNGQVGIPYQREQTKQCLATGCIMEFPVVPTKRRIDLSLANCAVQGTGSLSSMSIGLYQGSTHILSHELIQAEVLAQGSQTRRCTASRSRCRSVPASTWRRWCS
jgi:hypothetical protein